MKALALLAAALVATPLWAAPEPRTADAVRAADDAWTAAEIRGDADYVDALLLPGYRTIGSDGKVTTKAKLIANVRARGPNSDFGKRVADYRASHPMRADVAVDGDTAILSWVSLAPGKSEPLASCDIFLYRHGRWHAVYSQHSTAEM